MTRRSVKNALRCARGLRTAIRDAQVLYAKTLASVPLKHALAALNEAEARLLDARRRVVERDAKGRAA